MTDILQDLSEESLTIANLENIYASSPFPYNLPGTEVYEGKDISWCISEIPFIACNLVFKARFSEEIADEIISLLKERASTKGSPIRWYIDPETQPANIGEYLEKHEFKGFDRPTPFMAIDLNDISDESESSGCEIIEVTEPSDLKKWSEVATRGFGGTPENAERNFRWFTQIVEHGLPAHFYMAFLEGQPVATSQLVPAAGVGGIFYVATLPEFRNRGIGYAVTLKAVQAARDMGYRAATLQASQMGEPVYRRMGFWKHAEIPVYQWVKA